jgi:hypothetical protein
MNNTEIPEYTIYNSFALLGTLTGINLSESDFLTFARMATDKIKGTYLTVKCQSKPSKEGIIKLPCKTEFVKTVCDTESDFERWDAPWYDGKSFAYNRMGDRVINRSPEPSTGGRHYVNFMFRKPAALLVDPGMFDRTLFALFSILVKDCDGNLLLNDKQMRAVVYYVAYLSTERDVFLGKKSQMDLMYIRDKALNAVADASVPNRISDNDLNRILRAMSSFDRKSFNKDKIF